MVSHQNPRLYTGRLVGLLALAYAYQFLMLAGSLTLCGLMICPRHQLTGTVIFLPNRLV